MSETNPQQEHTTTEPLTMRKAADLAHAIRRARELQNQKIATPQRDAELRGITQMLSHEVPKHVDELLGCWFAVHREYEPLVESLASVLGRVQDTIQQRYHRANPTPPPAETPQCCGECKNAEAK